MKIGDIARSVSVRANAECELPVYAVTKHEGMVPSAEYFKKQVYSRNLEGYKVVEQGQFAYATIHLDEGSIGVLGSAERCIISPMYTVFEVDETLVYAPYLLRVLKSPWALTHYSAMGSGSVHRRRSITFETLSRLSVPLPAISEQKRISNIIDKAESVRRKRQEGIRLTEELLMAVFIDMYGDPSANPKGWPVLRMGDVIDFKGGSQPPKDNFIDEPRPGYVRLVQIRDFKTDRYKTYIPESLAKRSFEIDDVMIARYGPPVFQILRGLSGSYNVALMKAQPRSNVLPEFIFWLLQLPKYQQAVISNSERTAGQTGVNLDFLNALEVPLPPIEYQGEIAQMTQKITLLVSTQRRMLDECNKQLTALQSQFFS